MRKRFFIHQFEPWPALRHITPWFVLDWLNDKYHFCWVQMVLWKIYGSEGMWEVGPDCFYPYDYCGYYDHTATKQERVEGMSIAQENPVLYVDCD